MLPSTLSSFPDAMLVGAICFLGAATFAVAPGDAIAGEGLATASGSSLGMGMSEGGLVLWLVIPLMLCLLFHPLECVGSR